MLTFLYIDEVLPNVFASVNRRPYGSEVREFATTSDLQIDMFWRWNLFIYLFTYYTSYILLYSFLYVGIRYCCIIIRSK